MFLEKQIDNMDAIGAWLHSGLRPWACLHTQRESESKCFQPHVLLERIQQFCDSSATQNQESASFRSVTSSLFLPFLSWQRGGLLGSRPSEEHSPLLQAWCASRGGLAIPLGAGVNVSENPKTGIFVFLKSWPQHTHYTVLK